MTIDIAALRALVEAATPLPWLHDEDRAVVLFPQMRGGFDLSQCPDSIANAALIVAAVNALPALLAEVERLRDINRDVVAKSNAYVIDNARLSRDAERLDWIDAQWAHGIHVEVCAVGGAGDSLHRAATIYSRGATEARRCNLREAIDAAKEQTP